MHVGAGMLGMQAEQPGLQAQVGSLGVAYQGLGGRQRLRPLVTAEGRQCFDAE